MCGPWLWDVFSLVRYGIDSGLWAPLLRWCIYCSVKIPVEDNEYLFVKQCGKGNCEVAP